MKTYLLDIFDLQENVKLPRELAVFQRCEVVGCDTNSLQLYLEDKDAFGVVPNQVVNMGWDSIPTALVLYELDTARIFGLWHVKGREINQGEQVEFLNIMMNVL